MAVSRRTTSTAQQKVRKARPAKVAPKKKTTPKATSPKKKAVVKKVVAKKSTSLKKPLKKRVTKPKSSAKKTTRKKSSTNQDTPIHSLSVTEFVTPETTLETVTPAVEESTKVVAVTGNKTKMWGAVAITTLLIVAVWGVTLRFTVLQPITAQSDDYSVANENLNDIMTNLKHDWADLQNNVSDLKNNYGVAASEETSTTNSSTETSTSQPTSEELEGLFSDIN